jgi:hypothetical protein
MAKIGRILTVTLGLVLTGATFGAIIGGAMLLVWAIAKEGSFPIAEIVGFGALFGAVIGAVITPIASWTLLRRVPLGRAVAVATIGTALGAIAGGTSEAIGPVAGGLAGFAAGVIYLRVIAAPRLARMQASNALTDEMEPRIHTAESDVEQRCYD